MYTTIYHAENVFPDNISAILSISYLESELVMPNSWIKHSSDLTVLQKFRICSRFSLIHLDGSLTHWIVCSGFSNWKRKQKERWMRWILLQSIVGNKTCKQFFNACASCERICTAGKYDLYLFISITRFQFSFRIKFLS